jgi:hypothetical protein
VSSCSPAGAAKTRFKTPPCSEANSASIRSVASACPSPGSRTRPSGCRPPSRPGRSGARRSRPSRRRRATGAWRMPAPSARVRRSKAVRGLRALYRRHFNGRRAPWILASYLPVFRLSSRLRRVELRVETGLSPRTHRSPIKRHQMHPERRTHLSAHPNRPDRASRSSSDMNQEVTFAARKVLIGKSGDSWWKISIEDENKGTRMLTPCRSATEITVSVVGADA